MLLEPRVNRRKYDREVARLDRQRALLTKRGCFVLDATYPIVDVLFVPQRPLRIHFAVTLPTGTNAMSAVDLGQLSARPFVARISLDDYDLLAPSVTFLDAYTRQLLLDEQLVPGSLAGTQGQKQLVILAGHPVHKRPFLCVRGVREYHDHPQHTGDDWMLYRESFGTMDVVDLIWRACVASTRANLIFAPPQIEVRWEFEP